MAFSSFAKRLYVDGLSTLFTLLYRSAKAPAPRPQERVMAAQGATPARPIPRTIWSYWHSLQRPQVVELCSRNWARYNPGFEINVLNAATVGQYIDKSEFPDGFDSLPEFRRADWIRIALLRRWGGVWLDASILLTESLQWMLDAQSRHGVEYVGFYIDGFTCDADYPVIENWCMAAPVGSPFIDRWYQEFTEQVLRQGEAAYLDGLKRAAVYEESVQNIQRPEYLAMHVAAQRTLRTGGHSMVVYKAEDTALLYHHRLAWRRTQLCLFLLLAQCGSSVAPLVKLRGAERAKLDRMMSKRLYRQKSIVVEHLM